jgi:hypothetical protein
MMNVTFTPPFRIEEEVTPTRVGPVPSSERLQIARELLAALKDATRPGQAHLMHRVLSILQRELLNPDLPLSSGQAAAVLSAVAELEHEAARTVPDTALFSDRAQSVVDLLALA